MMAATGIAAAPADGADAPGEQQVRIRAFEAGDAAAWDAYVEAHALGTPFHLLAWKRSIEQTFGFRSTYLLASREGRVTGVLPLFFIRNPLAGRVLLSTPFAVYGGVLADDAATGAAFAEAVRQLGERLRVDRVELRNAYEEQCLGFTRHSRYVTFTQEIGPDEQAILESIPRKTRRMVRKSLENGLTTRVQRTDPGAFEALYQDSIRRLGTPAFPRKHFTNLLNNFGEGASIREVLHEGRAIAAVLSFRFRDQVLPYYGGSDPAFNALAPNNYMYFDQMREAGREGCRRFDFGRSKKGVAGSYDFKSHWGMAERELPYEVLLIRQRKLPDLSPANPKFDLPRRLWQKLPPPVARLIGPVLIRLVP